MKEKINITDYANQITKALRSGGILLNTNGDIREKTYPQDVDGTYPMADRDYHTMYVGEIVAAYIIK